MYIHAGDILAVYRGALEQHWRHCCIFVLGKPWSFARQNNVESQGSTGQLTLKIC